MMMNLPEVMKGQKKPRIVRFKPIKQSRQTEIWYGRQLVSRVKWLREQIERALQNKQSPFFMDSDFDVFNTEQLLSVIKKLSEKDRSNEIESLANEFVSRGNVQNQREVGENLKRQTGIDLQAFLNQNTAVLNKMSVMTTANVQLIKSIEQQYLDKVQTIITQGAISGKLNRDLAKEIRDLGGVTENRAKFIARDQSSKINAALTQARHEELGIKKYRWSTSGDERVRDSHAENDGKIFSYDDPPETGHPGHDINCRCVQIPVLDNVPTDKEKGSSEPDQKVEEKILPISGTTVELIEQLKNDSVEYKAIHLLKEKLSVDSIIEKLSGGDETEGSCASLALSYIGNRIGLDVTDYRGGKSREFFSIKANTRKLFSASGIKTKIFDVAKEAKDVAVILKKELELNKEYYLSTGRHAAIVRLSDKGLEYLELQSSIKNGWMSFDRYGSIVKTLQKRFACRLTPEITRMNGKRHVWTRKMLLAEVDSFKSRKSDLKEVLGYLNTATDKQKKGSTGGMK